MSVKNSNVIRGKTIQNHAKHKHKNPKIKVIKPDINEDTTRKNTTKLRKKNNKKKLRKFKLFLLCLILILLTSISVLSKTLNPFVTIRGIVLMQESTTGVVKLSDKPLKYICKSFYELTSVLRADGYVIIQRDNRIIEAIKNGKPHFLKSTDFLGVYEVFNEL